MLQHMAKNEIVSKTVLSDYNKRKNCLFFMHNVSRQVRSMEDEDL